MKILTYYVVLILCVELIFYTMRHEMATPTPRPTLRIYKPIIDNPELTRLLISQSLEKLPSTHGGGGYYILQSNRKYYVDDIIANLRDSDTLGWGSYAEYTPAVGDSKRYEIARVVIDHYISELGNAGFFARRLDKNAKEKFVNDIVAVFHVYGLFNQKKKELVCKVAEIISN